MKPRQFFLGLGVVVAIAVLVDMGMSVARSIATAPPEPTGPSRMYDPAHSAVYLTGERRERWLKQPPLKVGDKIRPLTIEGADGKKLRIPAPDGKPTVLAFTAAAAGTVMLVSPIREFEHYYRGRAHVGLVILNTDPVPWDEYRKEFEKTTLVRILDKEAKLLEKFRPVGDTPERMPSFWGFDGTGRVRYFLQPRDVYDIWTRPMRIALKLPKPDFEKISP